MLIAVSSIVVVGHCWDHAVIKVDERTKLFLFNGLFITIICK